MKYFPIKCKNKPTSYLSGAGAFGSNRENGGRLHAGSDLYATVGTEVYATDEGIIRKISDKFYRHDSANVATIDSNAMKTYLTIEEVWQCYEAVEIARANYSAEKAQQEGIASKSIAGNRITTHETLIEKN